VNARRWTIVAGKGSDGYEAERIRRQSTNFPDPRIAQFSLLKGIAVDGRGAVWVLEASNRIQVRDPDGTWKTLREGVSTYSPSKDGTRAGEFKEPRGFAVDANGVVWVADTGNHRLQVFLGGWRIVGGRPAIGAGPVVQRPGQFLSPRAIAIDGNGAVWVADNRTIQVRDADGRWKIVIEKGEGGFSAGEFNNPAGIAVDADGRVWVADTGNHRIQVRGSDGIWRISGSKPFARRNDVQGIGPGEFNNPSGIAVDADGRVWVVDTDNHRVQVREPNGEWRIAGGNPGGGDAASGTRPGEFHGPEGIAVDGNGAVWVADTWNYRIQRFGVG